MQSRLKIKQKNRYNSFTTIFLRGLFIKIKALSSNKNLCIFFTPLTFANEIKSVLYYFKMPGTHNFYFLHFYLMMFMPYL